MRGLVAAKRTTLKGFRIARRTTGTEAAYDD